MATIVPFKGLLYNPEKIKNLSDVVAPPYDVISQEERQVLHDRNPYNVIRLILGMPSEKDTPDNNPHTRATDYFNTWISEGILTRDDSPALYFTTLEFPLENKIVTRSGFIALIGLEPFEKRIVLPHEKTFSKVKSERLALRKKCRANFSSIFALYSDQNNILKTLKKAVSDKQPDMDIVDDKGHKQKMWRITDPSVCGYVSDAMKDSRIFIADGHHRYETALNYRNWLAETSKSFNADHPANFVMSYLCSMEDEGLIIRAAHRMLTELPEPVLSSFIQKAGDYFNISTIPFNARGREAALEKMQSTLVLNNSENAIGVYMKENEACYVLILKPDAMDRFKDELSEPLRKLDVTVLTRLIFMDILGLTQADLDNEQLITYSSVAGHAVQAVAAGKCAIAFILNPTKIDQVRQIAENGETMPRKATYFYPKVITGQVMNRLY